uniref:Centriolar coiled coil protein 110kDa n=1 Tax=Iconisemion striatum TaxID=60296 RepID=A0A1A7XX06_9TELE
MEDYDKFVQLCFCQMRENKEEEEHSKPLSPSSVICFSGRAILPPLLSGRQREEMQRHRDEAQKAAPRRMAYVQSLLHSVQLRKTPTLEELLRTESSRPDDTSGVPYSEGSVGTVENLSSTSVNKLKNGGFLPPKTSTTSSAYNASPQRCHHEGCLIDRSDSQESPSCSCDGENRQSPTSGCVMSTENIASISGRVDLRSQKCHLSSSETREVVQVPDIISHPPIDGEELERSGLEFVLFSDLLGATSFHSDLVTCDPLGAELSDMSRLSCSVEHKGDVTVTTKHHPFNSTDKNEVVVAMRDKTCLLDNSDSSQTLNNSHCPIPELHKAPSDAEPVDNQINTHPMSLQALLKRSQEYRRRQRTLRNQAKSAKIQERTKEQSKASTEEQSLSDKENDDKGTLTAGCRTAKERRDTSNNVRGSKITGEKANFQSKDGKNKDLRSTEEETSFRNKLNTSQGFITESKQSHVLIQQLPASADTSHVQDTSGGTKHLENFPEEGRNYVTVPVPSFCRSPVPCKSKGSPKEGLTVHEAETLVGCSRLNQLQVKNVQPNHRNLVVEDDVTSVFTKTSQQIDQLEWDLSSLKDLISDLESTVKDQDQTESCWEVPRLSEFMQNHRHVQQRDEDDESWRLQRNQFLNFKNTREDLGPEPSFSGVDDALLPVQEKEPTVVKINQQRLQTTATGQETAERDSQQAASFTHLLTAKCLTSVAQRMQIPTMFRSVPTGNILSCDVLVLTGQKNRPESEERAPEGQSSVRSPSLNQSYDVDTPSGLWFLEGSSSDPVSQSHLGHEKCLTTESGGEEQRVLSKVKRRLLMHETEGAQERNADPSSAAGPVVRPTSSNPTAVVRRNEGFPKDQQEQLQQVHAAQVRALQDEHRKQQEELLQALAARYRLLQNVSPCSVSGSRPGDALTFSTLSQPLGPLPGRYRPLLAAAVKGFLTRRLLRTERVSQLVCTIRDTQQFLQAFRQQDASRGESCSRQDVLLQKRVALQLRAAHYEVYDIFFSLSAREQMQLISWDRELARERRHRQQVKQVVSVDIR